MSRNPTVLRSPQNSFVDALESIAGTAIVHRGEEKHGSSTDHRWNQATLRKVVRHLSADTSVAAPSRDPRRAKESAGNQGSLSYEQALRRHARVDFDYDDLELATDPGPLSSTSAGLKTRKPATKDPRSAALDAPSRTAKSRRGARPGEERCDRNGSHDPSASTANHTPHTNRRKTRERKAVQAGGIGQQSLETAKTLSAQSPDRQAREMKERRDTLATAARKARERIKDGPAGQAPLAKLNPAQQRRTIVSLRLTDEEFDQLRLRAKESGINVSAYVRSCVTEAENLRSQVRHVMAEMRALGAVSLIQRHALPSVTQQEPGEKASWMQSIRRIASRLCRTPLAPFQRTA